MMYDSCTLMIDSRAAGAHRAWLRGTDHASPSPRRLRLRRGACQRLRLRRQAFGFGGVRAHSVAERPRCSMVGVSRNATDGGLRRTAVRRLARTPPFASTTPTTAARRVLSSMSLVWTATQIDPLMRNPPSAPEPVCARAARADRDRRV